jgi:hypothetical protein
MSTITGTQIHTPTVIEGASSSAPTRTIVHETLGGATVVTLRAAGPQQGSVSAVFQTEAAARALEADLRLAQTLTMFRDDLDADSVQFVPQGAVDVVLDTSVYVWVVTFDYVRVA